mmetsp:Transcript_31718/g.28095  ORF Transcript_31718/g.28095 Transcript_31718/m.28095 type:complete len:232 (+) Transcript_31718:428-1123(+)
MNLQTIFLKNLNNPEGLNYDCETYARESNMGNVTIGNIDFDVSCPQEKYERLKRKTVEDRSRNEITRNEFAVRRSQEVNLTAQVPRTTKISGVNTSRSVYLSPNKDKGTPKMAYRGSTESTKTPYLLNSENIQSTAKPPKFKRDVRHVRSPRESIQFKSRNYLPERHNSFDQLNFNALNKPKLSSTQSVKNLSHMMEPHTFRENSNNNLAKIQNGMNTLFDDFKKGRVDML